jgi:hypothetical protein
MDANTYSLALLAATKAIKSRWQAETQSHDQNIASATLAASAVAYLKSHPELLEPAAEKIATESVTQQ